MKDTFKSDILRLQLFKSYCICDLVNCETHGTGYQENAYNVGAKSDKWSTQTREIINIYFFEKIFKMVLTIYDETILTGCESEINDSEVMNKGLAEKQLSEFYTFSLKLRK